MMKDLKTTTEVVGIFNNYKKLQEAILELSMQHFERYDISVLGSEASIEEKFNKINKDSHELVDNPKTPRGTNIAPEEMAIAQGAVITSGMLIGVIAALTVAGGIVSPSSFPASIIGITAGAAAGEVLFKLANDQYLERWQKQIDKGGLIIWIRTLDKKRQKVALRVLKHYGAEDVHIHEIKL